MRIKHSLQYPIIKYKISQRKRNAIAAMKNHMASLMKERKDNCLKISNNKIGVDSM